MREGDSVDLGAEIGRLVRRVELANPDISASARIRKAWEIVADERIVAHTDAVYVVPGSSGEEVVIYVDSQIWATELNLQAELLRMRLNLQIQDMLERRGLVVRREDDALFDYEQAEHVKRLKFVPSKEKYTKQYHHDSDEDLEAIGREEVEPVALDDVELASLYVQVSHIQDEKVRKAAFDAARAGIEVDKGRVAKEELASE